MKSKLWTHAPVREFRVREFRVRDEAFYWYEDSDGDWLLGRAAKTGFAYVFCPRTNHSDQSERPYFSTWAYDTPAACRQHFDTLEQGVEFLENMLRLGALKEHAWQTSA